MPIAFLRQVFARAPDRPALIQGASRVSYAELTAHIDHEGTVLRSAGIPAGAVVTVEGDFSLASVTVLLALIEHGCIAVPLSPAVPGELRQRLCELAEVEWVSSTPDGRSRTFAATDRTATHHLFRELRRRRTPGLVLFSSGSSGAPKGIVHDLSLLLQKFTRPRPAARLLAFLLFDHIGGINTLFSTLSSAGSLVIPDGRDPEAVAATIAAHAVEILPTSPTFLGLMLLTRPWERHSMTSLRRITYGTEPMPPGTLVALARQFPHVELQQTYGLSELGILRSKSRAPDSLWVKIGGEGYETRVNGGLLEIRAASSMLGYLNAPSPFTPDGWFMTGDAVEQDGEWLRILGRDDAVINVGGNKVHPADVEAVLQAMPEVLEVVVSGEPNLLVGMVVKAVVRLRDAITAEAFRSRMQEFCRDRLPRHAIPQQVTITTKALHTDRFKKARRERQNSG
jgi:long-chain acyl-CoA synthetase